MDAAIEQAEFAADDQHLFAVQERVKACYGWELVRAFARSNAAVKSTKNADSLAYFILCKLLSSLGLPKV